MRPLIGVDIPNPHAWQVQAVEQTAVSVIGEQDLTVRPADIARQTIPAAGVVDTAQHITTQACRRHRGEHPRGISQQRPHVQRPARVGGSDQRCGLPIGLVKVFAPGPDPIAVLDRGCGVVAPFAEQLLDGVGHLRVEPGRPGSSRSRESGRVPRYPPRCLPPRRNRRRSRPAGHRQGAVGR